MDVERRLDGSCDCSAVMIQKSSQRGDKQDVFIPVHSDLDQLPRFRRIHEAFSFDGGTICRATELSVHAVERDVAEFENTTLDFLGPDEVPVHCI